MATRVELREISNEEGNRLLRIARRDGGSVVTWRRGQAPEAVGPRFSFAVAAESSVSMTLARPLPIPIDVRNGKSP